MKVRTPSSHPSAPPPPAALPRLTPPCRYDDPGITGGYGGDRRVEYITPEAARKKGVHEILIESSCNGMFGMADGGIGPPDPNWSFRLDMADVVVTNQEAWRLLWDFQTLREFVDTLPGNTPCASVPSFVVAFAFPPHSVFMTLCPGVPILPLFPRGPLEAAVYHILLPSLLSFPRFHTVTNVSPRLQNKALVTSNAIMNAFSHTDPASITCHIDTAWLWPYNVTQQKTARSWATQIDLMERCPAPLRVQPGAAVPLPLLPYTRLLPLRLLAFLRPPVLPPTSAQQYPTHFERLAMRVLACKFHPIGLMGRERREHALGRITGGPLPKMLENLRRMRTVTNTHRELASVNMEHSADEFFDCLAESTKAGKVLPTWHGELYLEFHRGAYTSHEGNRHSEILLRDVEHVATLASLSGSKKYVYPKQTLNGSWEKSTMVILPGSAIGVVCDDGEKLYAEVCNDGEKMLDDALDGAQRITRESRIATLGQVVAYNTMFFPRIPLGASTAPMAGDADGGVRGRALRGRRAACGARDVAHRGGVGLHACVRYDATSPALDVAPTKDSSVHRWLRPFRAAQLERAAHDLQGPVHVQLMRELMQDGATGVLVIFEDRPNFWDARDVEIHHLEKATPLVSSDVSVGPLRASVHMGRATSTSRWMRYLVQLHFARSLYAINLANAASTKVKSRSLFRFDAFVDWHQRHVSLKFELPLNIHSDNATYETQFGHLQRPTHKNITWDMAKFEVCGHKYADLSEHGYGVALLSESKYGFACQGNILHISLLRAATEPDAEQDQGEHTFSWAVMPHKGHFLESDPLLLNMLPVRSLAFGASIRDLNSTSSPFALIGAPNVFLETIARAVATNQAPPSRVRVLLYRSLRPAPSVSLIPLSPATSRSAAPRYPGLHQRPALRFQTSGTTTPVPGRTTLFSAG
ncbi:hypothetical protein B0H10DRAFT_2206336 [Mycena sp. CBHHK59/15]|nr:hypothetical protein B0H10DRAFT_2206336 [Mycena sp. CBHHK59/15]